MKTLLTIFTLGMFGCGDATNSAMNALTQQNLAKTEENPSGTARDGKDGINCFDSIGDRNTDGYINADDCVGRDGRDGQGLKGDKGETGAQGIQGERGEQGTQGERGEQGTQGERGERGEQGTQGARGPSVLAYDSNDTLAGFVFDASNFPISLVLITEDDLIHTISVSTGRTLRYFKANSPTTDNILLFADRDCTGNDSWILHQPVANQVIDVNGTKFVTKNAAPESVYYRSYGELSANGMTCTNQNGTLDLYPLDNRGPNTVLTAPFSFDYQ